MNGLAVITLLILYLAILVYLSIFLAYWVYKEIRPINRSKTSIAKRVIASGIILAMFHSIIQNIVPYSIQVEASRITGMPFNLFGISVLIYSIVGGVYTVVLHEIVFERE